MHVNGKHWQSQRRISEVFSNAHSAEPNLLPPPLMTIHDFPLAWRWTDPKYVKLPANVLAQITPLEIHAAKTTHDQWLPFFDKSGQVIRSRFSNVEICHTEGNWRGDACRREPPLIANVADWLRTRERDSDLFVIISWRPECAVRTTWGIFTQWWDDFCYAGSDDAFIVPDSSRWFLAFHHEDWFSFCREPDQFQIAR